MEQILLHVKEEKSINTTVNIYQRVRYRTHDLNKSHTWPFKVTNKLAVSYPTQMESDINNLLNKELQA